MPVTGQSRDRSSTGTSLPTVIKSSPSRSPPRGPLPGRTAPRAPRATRSPQRDRPRAALSLAHPRLELFAIRDPPRAIEVIDDDFVHDDLIALDRLVVS